MDDSDFTYEEQLGRGVAGQVWLARDPHGRRFALKFFSDATADFRERSALEHASALIRVHHPAVVKVLKVQRLGHPDTGEDQLAVVMEYVEGRALSLYGDPIPLPRAVKFASQLAEGLQAIHDAGLVHGDMHSGNVIIGAESAKIVDILYTHSMAAVGPGTRAKTRQEDVRDFARILRNLLEQVVGIDPDALAGAYYTADRGATPGDVLSSFAPLWEGRVSQSSAPESAHIGAARRRVPLFNRAYLALSRLDRWGTVHVTHVVSNRRIIASLPGLVLATRTRLLEMVARSRPVSVIRESLLEAWRQDSVELKPSDYESTVISAPSLVSSDGTLEVPLSSPEPLPQARLDLFSFHRSVGIMGRVGPYLFVEERDSMYGGGAHDDRSDTFALINLEDGGRLPTLLDEQERAEWTEREGSVARATFRALRESELILDDFEIDLSAAAPTYQTEGDAELRLRVRFTTSASFAQSDRRWSSYTISEEVPTRRLPKLLLGHEGVPAELPELMRSQAGEFVGWSELDVGHPGLEPLRERLSRSDT